MCSNWADRRDPMSDSADVYLSAAAGPAKWPRAGLQGEALRMQGPHCLVGGQAPDEEVDSNLGGLVDLLLWIG